MLTVGGKGAFANPALSRVGYAFFL
jgi:hypothetical protein